SATTRLFLSGCASLAATTIAFSLQSLGLSRPLVIIGGGGFNRLKDMLHAALKKLSPPFNLEGGYNVVSVRGEPELAQANKIAQVARALNCDCVLAVGGGSVLDMGKCVGALATNYDYDALDYLEVVGKGRALEHPLLPVIAVPTTSGTGSEVTKNGVLKSPCHKRKVSLRSNGMLPKVAIIDPLLTLSCPPSVTAHVGMDTLCQCLEPFLSNAPSPITDCLSRDGIIRASRSLRAAVLDGGDVQAREDMAVASMMGGLSLANSRLGTVHGIAGVLGGRYEDTPHGALCASLLPYVFEANIQKLQQMSSSSQDNDELHNVQEKLSRFVEASKLMTNSPRADIQDGIVYLHALLRDLEIPPLGELCKGMNQEHFDEIADHSLEASSTKGNCVVLSKEEIIVVLKKAF
ncbi:iron-containing alcohol dehydrogenase, partial [archaeon]